MKKRDLAKMNDYELLRPLYVAAAISPICLLLGTSIANGHTRIPLYECTEVSDRPS